MEDLWRRIEAAEKKRGGSGSLKLRDPATEEDIRLAEGTMELRFPRQFRESLLWHDGQKRSAELSWLEGAPPLQPLDAIVARWLEEGKPARIPIAGTPEWSGPIVYLDPSGRVLRGRPEDENLEVLGGSLQEVVEPWVRQLEDRAANRG